MQRGAYKKKSRKVPLDAVGRYEYFRSKTTLYRIRDRVQKYYPMCEELALMLEQLLVKENLDLLKVSTVYRYLLTFNRLFNTRGQDKLVRDVSIKGLYSSPRLKFPVLIQVLIKKLRSLQEIDFEKPQKTFLQFFTQIYELVKKEIGR